MAKDYRVDQALNEIHKVNLYAASAVGKLGDDWTGYARDTFDQNHNALFHQKNACSLMDIESSLKILDQIIEYHGLADKEMRDISSIENYDGNIMYTLERIDRQQEPERYQEYVHIHERNLADIKRCKEKRASYLRSANMLELQLL